MFPLLKDGQAYRLFHWPILAILLISFTMLLRLSLLGIVNLLPEEAYYWAYAQNLDFSYLDHPPMVAWLIRLSTTLLGNTELAVRIPSWLCSLVAVTYLFGLAYNLYGKSAAYVSALLLAVLPIYFSVGFVMTPDAPLYAAWAATLFYFERAFLGGRSKSWFGVGVGLGLGMLSKYTIALLGPAAIIFSFLDPTSRRWYLRPEPYLAGFIAALLFCPVLFWNMHHDWASFAFQGPNRWSGKHEFALHLLLGTALAQLTPFGLVGLLAALGIRLNPVTSDRRRRFVVIFTLVPLFVFILHSLQNSPKLNWTGPVWLAGIPLLAHHLALRGYGLWRNLSIFSPRIWKPALLSLPLLYGGFLCCLHFGIGWFTPNNRMPLPIAWAEMARLVEEIETPFDEQSKGNMVVVGMDKYSISSELAFYDLDGDGMSELSGQHLFGENSLMWAFWKPSLAAQGKVVLMVGFRQEDLQNPVLAKYFERVGPVSQQRIVKNGRTVGQFFYRVGYGYQPDNLEKPYPMQVVSLAPNSQAQFYMNTPPC
jgi:dolichol-phosphate mannosyltransferase